MSKKVIVFGATGLMGQQIVKESIKAGNDVTIYPAGNLIPGIMSPLLREN